MATAVKKRVARVYSPEETSIRAAVDSHLSSVRDLVRSYEIDFREDHAGDPAVYVTLRVAHPNDAEPAKMKRILKFWTKVSAEIREHDVTRFPYVKLSGAAKR